MNPATNEELVAQAKAAVIEQVHLLETCLNDFYTTKLIEESRRSSAAITELNRRACEQAAKERNK